MTTELIKLTLEFRGLSDEEDDTKVDIDPDLEDPADPDDDEDDEDGGELMGSME